MVSPSKTLTLEELSRVNRIVMNPYWVGVIEANIIQKIDSFVPINAIEIVSSDLINTEQIALFCGDEFIGSVKIEERFV